MYSTPHHGTLVGSETQARRFPVTGGVTVPRVGVNREVGRFVPTGEAVGRQM